MIALTLVLGTLVFGAPPSYACSCMPPEVPRHLKDSALVFTGTAKTVRRPKDRWDPVRPVVYTFRVDHAYKGKPKATISVNTHTQSAACGTRFSRGARYLVFAYKWEGRLATNMCVPNMKVAHGKGPITVADLPKGADPQTIKQLGKPRKVR
ncbi:hypothetical protein [Herbidospora sp. NBRC 101105]|uniref:hypothetical protein n=1 Tax=Herbidospora sp. NBRC 101105 TaxID=3032195 RepID=UPI0025579200|nr:hypothetical protein [Herbidospora sp. NBRC 101105]